MTQLRDQLAGLRQSLAGNDTGAVGEDTVPDGSASTVRGHRTVPPGFVEPPAENPDRLRSERVASTGSTAAKTALPRRQRFLQPGGVTDRILAVSRDETDASQAAITSSTAEVSLDLSSLDSYPVAPVVASNQKVQWDHSQVVGPPDTTTAGDQPTAWAPRSPGSGVQWLQVGYDRAVELKEINIHQSYNPGAISKVTALTNDGSERTVWEGNAGAGEGIVEASVPVPPGITANQLKIYVDTDRVRSWPEIDAVEMVGADGSRQWASQSAASSSYSSVYSGMR